MLIFREIKQNLIPSSCLALGMFDGVHIGHQKVILDAVKKSGKIDAISAVVTFSKHPQNITARTPTLLITSLEDRLAILEEIGVQTTIVLDFDEKLSRLSAENYLQKYLIDGLNAKSISVGYNHHFGEQKRGNIEFLEKQSEHYGYQLSVIPPISIDGQIVSSSVIRELLSFGNVYQASKLLGRPFAIKGHVVKGKQRGRILGFPTANIKSEANIIVPAAGVYSGVVSIENTDYYTVVNIGIRPTFGDLTENLIEAHIIDFSGDLYDETIEISFLEKIRDEKKFNSLDELKSQIKLDCQHATTCSPNIQVK